MVERQRRLSNVADRGAAFSRQVRSVNKGGGGKLNPHRPRYMFTPKQSLYLMTGLAPSSGLSLLTTSSLPTAGGNTLFVTRSTGIYEKYDKMYRT